MKQIQDTLRIIGAISAIAFATLLLFPSLFFLIKELIEFRNDNLPIIMCFLGGIAGYFGLWMLLSKNKSIKFRVLNIILLIFGVSSFVGFTSITGGERAWKWVLTFEELDEWFFIVYLSIIFICLLTLNVFYQKLESIK
ncbi:hypothetical protein WAF17_09055 [Bernardetia sp. ABR2-2B]|uniref:hypothetical protein n=1 Tax=Bernardetia sp. ABR2-2B TaxID=3127472 RepID=UPI0030D28455